MAEDVASLRTAGATWLQIGNALGVTRSAAQQYYGRN
jgi:predicted transcriptional regulator